MALRNSPTINEALFLEMKEYRKYYDRYMVYVRAYKTYIDQYVKDNGGVVKNEPSDGKVKYFTTDVQLKS